MDDTNQSQNAKVKSQNGDNDQVQLNQGGTLVQFPSGISQQPQDQQVPSGSSLQKEQEPFPSKPFIPEVAVSEPTVEISPDLEAAGVKDAQTVPQVAEELQKVGVQAVSDQLPQEPLVKEMPIKSPIDEGKAEQITKGSFFFKNPSSSLLWLALLVLRQLKMKKNASTSSGQRGGAH